MNKAWVLLAAVAVSGCDRFIDPPEVKACEAYIQGTLDAPATYKRAELSTFDEQMDKAAFTQRFYPGKLSQIERMQLQIYGEPLGVRNVLIKYDVDNSYGTPIRGMNACQFVMSEGKIDNPDGLMTIAERKARYAQLRAAGGEALGPSVAKMIGQRSAEMDCCMP